MFSGFIGTFVPPTGFGKGFSLRPGNRARGGDHQDSDRSTGPAPQPSSVTPTAPPGSFCDVPPPQPESQEQFRARLADSVPEPLDQDGQTWTSVEGTYPDRVIVFAHSRPALNGPW